MDRKSAFILIQGCLIAAAILLLPVFSLVCAAANVSLGWDANPEPDLEGYVIYRNEGSSGPPYRFSSTLPEDELSNPLLPVVTLTGLKQNTEYFISVTAYDSEGNESYFSDELCVQVVDSVIESCAARISSSGNTASSSGGNNNGPCFICSAAGGSNNDARLAVIFAIATLVFVALRAFTAVHRRE